MPPKELISNLLSVDGIGPITVNTLLQSSKADRDRRKYTVGDTIRLQQALTQICFGNPGIIDSLNEVDIVQESIAGLEPADSAQSKQAVLSKLFGRRFDLLNLVPGADEHSLIGQTLELDEHIEYGTELSQRLQIDIELAGKGPNPKFSGHSFLASNESHLPFFYQFLEGKTGAIAGVGVEQILDIYAYSDAEQAFVIELSHQVNSATRLLLEAGAFHLKFFGRYPTPSELISYFDPNNLYKFISMIGANLLSYDLPKLSTQPVQNGVRVKQNQVISYDSYLRNRSRLIDPSAKTPVSWLHDFKSTRRVIKGYVEGRIHLVNSDVTNPEMWRNITEEMGLANTNLIGLYLSNAEEYQSFREPDKILQWVQTLMRIPFSSDALIMRTISSANGSIATLNPDYSHPFNRQVLNPWHYNVQAIREYIQTPFDYLTRIKGSKRPFSIFGL